LRITCEVKPKSKNAVIVAQGGLDAGYSLYLVDGVPAFAVREGRKLSSVTSAHAPGDSYSIEAQLQDDGTLTLSIDNGPAAKGKAAGLITRQPRESMCVGFDNGAPVAKYKNKATDPFQGTITGLKVVTGQRTDRQ
jgi:hypothetical protein